MFFHCTLSFLLVKNNDFLFLDVCVSVSNCVSSFHYNYTLCFVHVHCSRINKWELWEKVHFLLWFFIPPFPNTALADNRITSVISPHLLVKIIGLSPIGMYFVVLWGFVFPCKTLACKNSSQLPMWSYCLCHH